MAQRPDIRLSPEEQTAFLHAQRKCALATVDRDGCPHVVAMNYAYRDGVFWMTSYGKAQKVVNIRRNPKVAVMVESGSSYAELKWVMARGECDIIDDPELVVEVFAWLSAGRATPRPAAAQQSATKRVVLAMHPRRIASWDHTKLGGRY